MNIHRISIFAVFLAVLAGLVVLILFAGAQNANAATIYVDDSGGKDYTTIQAGINAASAGGTVYVYNGTYNEQVSISKTINLTGESNQSTTIQGTGTGTGIYISVNYVNISNLKIDNFRYGIELYSSLNNITSNTITNTGYDGIFLSTSNNNIITSNTIANCSQRGILVTNTCSNNNISSNTITNNAWFGICSIGSSSSIITSNTITNCGNGIYFDSDSNSNTASTNTVTNCTNGINIDASSNNNATTNNIYGNTAYGLYYSGGGSGNTAYNNWWGSASGPHNAAGNPSGTGDNITDGVAFSPWATRPFGTGRTIYVNAAGGADYTTIPDAINAAIVGDTVYVYNGTYYVNWTSGIAISKSINLVGEDNQSVIIQGAGVQFSYGIQVTANYVNISNMKIDNFYYGTFLSSSSNNTITGNTVTNCSYGIYLGSSSNNDNITWNTVTNCVYFGIAISSCSSNNITSNTIANCDKGIYFSSNSNYNNVNSSFKFALYDNGQLVGYWNNGSTMNLMPLGKGSVTFWYIPTSSVAQHKFTVKMIEASTGAVVGEKSFESQVDMKVTPPAASQDYITTFVLPLVAILAIALAVVAVMLLRNKGMNTPKKKSEEKKLPPRK